MAAFLTSAAFGAALTMAGVTKPGVILSQLRWEDSHMLQVFLTATAASAACVSVTHLLTRNKSGEPTYVPRAASTFGYFSYDANILGGSLLGLGMTLSGSCPGTVLAQTGLGLQVGYYGLAGALAGGCVWVLTAPWIRRHQQAIHRPPAPTEVDSKDITPKSQKKVDEGPPRKAVYDYIFPKNRFSRAVVESVFVGLLVTTVGFLYRRSPNRVAVYGGLAVGGAQALTMIFRHTLLGVSSVYEDAGRWCTRALGLSPPSSIGARSPATAFLWSSSTSSQMGLGMMAGAWLFQYLTGIRVPDATAPLAKAQVFLGGMLLSFGSRLAGGCTSGHGISGMALLSVSSFVTISSAFAAGALAAWMGLG